MRRAEEAAARVEDRILGAASPVLAEETLTDFLERSAARSRVLLEEIPWPPEVLAGLNQAEDLFAAVAQACDREPLIFEGDRREITSVGIVTGAAQREYHQAVAAGLDAYITGEATEWVLHQAAEDGVHYLAAGHYATERFGVIALGRWLEQHHGLEVEFIDLPNPV